MTVRYGKAMEPLLKRKEILCGCAATAPETHDRFSFRDCECQIPGGRTLFKAKVLRVKEL